MANGSADDRTHQKPRPALTTRERLGPADLHLAPLPVLVAPGRSNSTPPSSSNSPQSTLVSRPALCSRGTVSRSTAAEPRRPPLQAGPRRPRSPRRFRHNRSRRPRRRRCPAVARVPLARIPRYSVRTPATPTRRSDPLLLSRRRTVDCPGYGAPRRR